MSFSNSKHALRFISDIFPFLGRFLRDVPTHGIVIYLALQGIQPPRQNLSAYGPALVASGISRDMKQMKC